MSLSTQAIDRLFQRLSATYGAHWTRQWADVPMTDIKTVWSHELSMFSDNLKAIGWALENLPDYCPNLMQFKTLCKQAPKPDYKHLESPKAPLDLVDSEILKMVKTLVEPQKDKDYKAWAKRLKARDEAGEVLSPHQIWSYKTALELLPKPKYGQ